MRATICLPCCRQCELPLVLKCIGTKKMLCLTESCPVISYDHMESAIFAAAGIPSLPGYNDSSE